MCPAEMFRLVGAVPAGVLVRIIPSLGSTSNDSSQAMRGVDRSPPTTAGAACIGEESLACSFRYRMER